MLLRCTFDRRLGWPSASTLHQVLPVHAFRLGPDVDPMLALYFYSDPHTFDMTKLWSQPYSTEPVWGPWLPAPRLAALLSVCHQDSGFFPFHRGCRMHTSRRRPHLRHPCGILLRWAPTAFCGSTTRCFRRRPSTSRDAARPLGSWNMFTARSVPCTAGSQEARGVSSISHMGYVMLGMALHDTGYQWRRSPDVQPRNDHGDAVSAGRCDYDRAHHGISTALVAWPPSCGLHGHHGSCLLRCLGLPAVGVHSEVWCCLAPGVPTRCTRWSCQRRDSDGGLHAWTLQRIYLGKPNEKYLSLPRSVIESSGSRWRRSAPSSSCWGSIRMQC